MRLLKLFTLTLICVGFLFSCKPDTIKPQEAPVGTAFDENDPNAHQVEQPCNNDVQFLLVAAEAPSANALWGNVVVNNNKNWMHIRVRGALAIAEAAVWHGGENAPAPVIGNDKLMEGFQIHETYDPPRSVTSFKIALETVEECNHLVIWAKLVFADEFGNVFFTQDAIALGDFDPTTGTPVVAYCNSTANCPNEDGSASCEKWRNASNPCDISNANNGAPSSCCDCDKSTGMKSLTVTYEGPSGVDVYGISNGESLGSWSNVQNGDHLFLDASDHSIGKFKNNISVVVGGVEYNIHTSCSQVIVGESVGPLTNIRHEDNSGNICEDGAVPCGDELYLSGSSNLNTSGAAANSTNSSKKSTKSSKKSTKSSKKSSKSSKKSSKSSKKSTKSSKKSSSKSSKKSSSKSGTKSSSKSGTKSSSKSGTKSSSKSGTKSSSKSGTKTSSKGSSSKSTSKSNG